MDTYGNIYIKCSILISAVITLVKYKFETNKWIKLVLCLDSKNCVIFPSRENQQSVHGCSSSRWPMKINEFEQQRQRRSGLPTVTYTANFLSCVSWADSLSRFQCSSDGEHSHSSKPSQTKIAGWKEILAILDAVLSWAWGVWVDPKGHKNTSESGIWLEVLFLTLAKEKMSSLLSL